MFSDVPDPSLSFTVGYLDMRLSGLNQEFSPPAPSRGQHTLLTSSSYTLLHIIEYWALSQATPQALSLGIGSHLLNILQYGP